MSQDARDKTRQNVAKQVRYCQHETLTKLSVVEPSHASIPWNLKSETNWLKAALV